MAAQEGLEVKALTLKMIHPLPDEEIRNFLVNLKHVIIPEVNYTGQLCQILRAKYLYPFKSFTKCTFYGCYSSEFIKKQKTIP